MSSNRLKAPTAVYAVLGASDLVVERLRAFHLEREVEQLQAHVVALPVQAQGRVQAGVAAAVGQASETYVDLATRGESLVGRIRRQKSTHETIDAAANATSRAKATVTTAKRAATSIVTSAKATRTTAQKVATSTVKVTADAAEKIGD